MFKGAIFTCLFLAIFIACAMTLTPTKTAQGADLNPKWEYLEDPGTSKVLTPDRLGSMGWELVTVENGTYYYKRRK